jgi:hypothetical protein
VLLQHGFRAADMRCTLAHPDPCHDLLAIQLVRHADNMRLDDARVGVQNLFNFARAAIGSGQTQSLEALSIT